MKAVLEEITVPTEPQFMFNTSYGYISYEVWLQKEQERFMKDNIKTQILSENGKIWLVREETI